MMIDFFLGGAETTTNALSGGVMLLIRHPDVWERLRDDPERHLPTFIEEAVRLESPVQGLVRQAAEDVELHGVTIPAGAVVMVRYGAGNRDERKFECPNDIDLDRTRPKSHLGYGFGTHHCLGAPLARRELYFGFKALVARVQDMGFVEGANDFSYQPNVFLRALKELHVEFTPRSS
jgi:cytochrome P450